MLEHGGRLREAATHFNIPLTEWLDLSTGINPNGWPVEEIPATCWGRLPEDGDELEAVARKYYETKSLLPVAGTQAAIQALPLLRQRAHVSVLHPGYSEHAAAWQRAGHSVVSVSAEKVTDAVAKSDVVVLINPNNPTGVRFSIEQLLAWHQKLRERNGWLVVDEAFMDTTPEQRICRYTTRDGLIVLRSLGKFFGLAGARVGFVCAQPDLLKKLNVTLGPWSISTPARWVATAAITDRSWQQKARQRLNDDSVRLINLLAHYGLDSNGGCSLFQWVRTPEARQLHNLLAHQGVLTRLFNQPYSLRFGLPGNKNDWIRLDSVLNKIMSTKKLTAAL